MKAGETEILSPLVASHGLVQRGTMTSDTKTALSVQLKRHKHNSNKSAIVYIV